MAGEQETGGVGSGEPGRIHDPYGYEGESAAPRESAGARMSERATVVEGAQTPAANRAEAIVLIALAALCALGCVFLPSMLGLFATASLVTLTLSVVALRRGGAVGLIVPTIVLSSVGISLVAGLATDTIVAAGRNAAAQQAASVLPGGRDEPYQIGESFVFQNIEYTVNSIDWDADAEVAADFPDEQEPFANHHYVTVNLTMTNVTEFAVEVARLQFDTNQSSAYTRIDERNEAPEPRLLDDAQLTPGVPVTVNLRATVPDDDPIDVILFQPADNDLDEPAVFVSVERPE